MSSFFLLVPRNEEAFRHFINNRRLFLFFLTLIKSRLHHISEQRLNLHYCHYRDIVKFSSISLFGDVLITFFIFIHQ